MAGPRRTFPSPFDLRVCRGSAQGIWYMLSLAAIETDANVTVGLIAREKVRIWTRLVSLVTMALCVGHSLLNTWGLFNWDSNRTATLAADETRLHTPVQKQGLPDWQITVYDLCNSARLKYSRKCWCLRLGSMRSCTHVMMISRWFNTDLSLKYKPVWNQLIQESSWARNWLIMIHSNFISHAEHLQD